MLKESRKERIPELKNPGDPESEWCSPGSIEQQLDMCEEGSLRGDEIERHTEHEPVPAAQGGDPMAVDREFGHFDVHMEELDREGDSMSGDEHSAGLQGGEPEIEGPDHIEPGMPGDENPTRPPRAKREGER